MRVLFITHNYPRFKGDPSGGFIKELVKALPTEITVEVLCPHARGLETREERGQTLIHRFRYADDCEETLAYEGRMAAALKRGIKGLSLLSRFNSAFTKGAGRLLKEGGFDLVHAHWLIPGGLAAKKALKGMNTPMVLSTHGTDVRMVEKIPGGGMIARKVLNRTDMVLPVSGFLGERLKRLGGAEPRMEVLPMPASERFTAEPRKVLVRRLAAVGNLTAQKRFHILIVAMGILGRRGIELELDLVGDGDRRSGLQELARTENVTVNFLGRRPHQDLPGILANSGILVLPSVAEGFGMALVEAQLAGLAVIGADAGGQREIIEHEKTGILVKPDDPGALAGAIEDLLADEEKTLAMAGRGRQAASRFLPVPTAARLARIYGRILK